MKFTELFDIVITEAHKDAYTGVASLFSRAPNARSIIRGMEPNSFERLIKQTGIPITKSFIETLMYGDNIFLPDEVENIYKDIDKYLISNFKVTASKARKLSKILLAWLKSNQLVVKGKVDDKSVEDIQGYLSEQEYNRIMWLFDNPELLKRGSEAFIYSGAGDLGVTNEEF